MENIVDRCRAAAADDRLSTGSLYAEAADEIERLRNQRNHWMAAARAFDDHLATMRVMFMEQPGYWDKARATSHK